jgi:hypothetical protein
MNQNISGVVTCDNLPTPDADLLLLDGKGGVRAFAHADAQGRYQLVAPAGYDGGWVLARLYQPIVGVVAVPVKHPDEGPATANIAVAQKDGVTLSGELVLPAGATAQGVELRLSPQHLAAVPAQAERAFLADGMGPGIRSAFLTRRLTEPRFQVRLLPGRYTIKLDREIDAPTGSLPEPNLAGEGLTADGQHQAVDRYGWFDIDIAHDRHVVVALKRL